MENKVTILSDAEIEQPSQEIFRQYMGQITYELANGLVPLTEENMNALNQLHNSIVAWRQRGEQQVCSIS